MFDFRLKVFYTVAKRLNFTKAASELFITQPAVTKHIQETEKHFNAKLFERNGTKIALTPAGELLLQHTEKLFSVYRDLEFEMGSLAQHHSGILRIGASTTIAQYILPAVLAVFHKRFIDIQPQLTINNTELIELALQRNEIDLGIIEGHSKNSSFKYTPFIKDELVLVVRTGHPLAKNQSVTLQELLKTPLLLREPGSGTLEVIVEALKPLGIKLSQLTVEMQLGSTEGMKRYLQNSDAAAFLSVHSIISGLQQNLFTIIDIDGLSIERNMYFIQKHGEEGALPGLFMDFACRYNFK